MEVKAIKNAVTGVWETVEEYSTELQVGLGVGIMTLPGISQAALSADVDTAITAAQTDGLAMISKGYLYLGAIGGALVLLGLFYRILRKPGR